MIFCWNIRGLNGRNKQREVSRWIISGHYLIGGLLETRVRQPNLSQVMNSTLPGWKYEANYSQDALNGRIVVVWRPFLSVVNFFKSDQLVLYGVHNPATNKSFTVAFAYGRHTEVDRRPLWDCIRNLAASRILSESPWLVLGDFNQVLNTQELYSLIYYSPSIQGMLEFQTCLEDSALFDLPYRGCLLTWANRQPTNPIARKLDRALCNEPWLEAYPLSLAEFQAPGPSDHSPCQISLDSSIQHRKTPFKYFTYFSSHPDYNRLIQESWLDVIDFGSGMVTLCKRLRSAKFCCKALNRSKFNNIQKRSKDAFELLEIKQNQLLNQPSQALFEEEKQARDDWIFWSGVEETFFKLKSRIRWLGEGDANTAFFFKSVKANLVKNIIHHLRDSNDTKVSDQVTLKLMVEQFYSQLLGQSNQEIYPLSIQSIRAIHPFRCTSSLAAQLLVIPSIEEITRVVFDLPRNKAPGPDGFSVEFFTSSWQLVGPDIIAGVLDFFHTSKMLRQVNATTISLIPKIQGADRLSQFRPISCCNTVYKVISRILASRLKLFISDAVQSNQVGFIPGRLLCENVLLASELVSDFNNPGPTTRGCLQVDITKAYDKVEWKFIINILKAFEIPDRFIGWIVGCLTTTSFSISFNGELVGFFSRKTRVKTGGSHIFIPLCTCNGYSLEKAGPGSFKQLLQTASWMYFPSNNPSLFC